MNVRTLLVAAAIAALGAAGIWFISTHDRVPVRVWTGFTGEAQRYPFLALERLVRRLGGEARELRNVGQLGELPARGVVLLPARRDNVSDVDRRRLLEWVSRGGRLVVEAEPFGLDDPLLASLGVTRDKVPPAPPPGTDKQRPRVPTYTWPGEQRPLATTLLPSPPLSHPRPEFTLAWNNARALVAVPHGKGRVIAVSSLNFARNGAIGGADNATLAWHVVGAGEAPLAIFNRPERLSLWGWLARNAWPALVGAALLLALWLARIVPRFGPVAPDPLPVRRRLLDHLLAAGRFHWSTRRAGHLTIAARDAALRHLGRVRPDFAAATPRERETLLVESFDLSPADAHSVIAGTLNPRTPAELVRAIALFQAIHERATRRPT
jgi:hypothetical protein